MHSVSALAESYPQVFHMCRTVIMARPSAPVKNFLRHIGLRLAVVGRHPSGWFVRDAESSHRRVRHPDRATDPSVCQRPTRPSWAVISVTWL